MTPDLISHHFNVDQDVELVCERFLQRISQIRLAPDTTAEASSPCCCRGERYCDRCYLSVAPTFARKHLPISDWPVAMQAQVTPPAPLQGNVAVVNVEDLEALAQSVLQGDPAAHQAARSLLWRMSQEASW